MTHLQPGDPAPWFTARSVIAPKFELQTLGGSHVLLCFFASTKNQTSRRVLVALKAASGKLESRGVVICGITVDRNDEAPGAVHEDGNVFTLFDFDCTVSRLYGVVDPESGKDGTPLRLRPCSFILDRNLRIIDVLPFGEPESYIAALIGKLTGLPAVQAAAPAVAQPPALTIPAVLEPELCRTLIDYFLSDGGLETGVFSEVDDRTVPVLDPRIKRRRDREITDETLRLACRQRIARRVFPEIAKAFQFKATWLERYNVACYDAASAGFFYRHRDDTTKGTAHRRFALTINLNAEDYEGGDLRFPEFGSRLFRAPTGGAIVFSCRLMHEVTKVTAGSRYCLIPFIYDDAAARIRDENKASNVSEADGAALIRKAAEAGDADAQYRLGVIYDLGQGTAQDLVQAHLWLSLAARNASGSWRRQALESRDRVAQKMNAKELRRSHELVEQLRGKIDRR